MAESEHYENVTMVTVANVRRLETDAGGRTVTEVVAEPADGSTARFRGDIVVAACGAVNSAALLLRSANDRNASALGPSRARPSTSRTPRTIGGQQLDAPVHRPGTGLPQSRRGAARTSRRLARHRPAAG
ncbi:hypothetical protein ACIGZJ_32050 [Kitasatospora sp. NPDC052868]|uniref:hypothetical protein n=1 Tax=Kitasatospora sp. NPDC052868 TaxID=3364060 RepID=UPI0037CA654F